MNLVVIEIDGRFSRVLHAPEGVEVALVPYAEMESEAPVDTLDAYDAAVERGDWETVAEIGRAFMRGWCDG